MHGMPVQIRKAQFLNAGVGEQPINIGGVESNEVADLQERNSALENQPPNESLSHPQTTRQAGHVEQLRRCGLLTRRRDLHARQLDSDDARR